MKLISIFSSNKRRQNWTKRKPK